MYILYYIKQNGVRDRVGGGGGGGFGGWVSHGWGHYIPHTKLKSAPARELKVFFFINVDQLNDEGLIKTPKVLCRCTM
jgi:hypothetical protein